MSGDVQARKRKEKRRKKDEEDIGIPSPPLGNLSESSTDNVTIHIYKESSTGGHWCARIIFFALLTILIGLIGIIIFEHRGTTDINTPLESSRWAFIFDGWVDDSISLNDEELHDEEKEKEHRNLQEGNYDTRIKSTDNEIENLNEEDESVEEKEDVESVEEKEDESVDEKEEDESVDEKEEDESVEEKEEEINDFDKQEQELTDNELDEEENNILQLNEVDYISRELNDQESYEDETQRKYIQEDEEIDDTNVLEEVYVTSKEKHPDENNMPYEVNNPFDEILETPTDKDTFETFLDIAGIDQINDNNMEPLEEVDSIDAGEYVSDMDINTEIEEAEEESASVAMKFGVGVALVVAAHFVLVKRWNNEVSFVQNASKLDIPKKQDKEGKIISKEEQLFEARKYENEMRDKEEDDEKMMKETEYEEEFDSEEGEEEEEEEIEDEWIEKDEEEEDEEEIEEVDEEEEVISQQEKMEMTGEEEEEEAENFDDSELIAKLEAKYGKLEALQSNTMEVQKKEEKAAVNNMPRRKRN